MSDYIERQAVIDAVHEEFDGCTVWDESGKRTADEVESIIDRVPSVDVAPVVRCRKCKYFRTYRCMDSMPIETCELAQTFYNPDLDFCSLAKRREE